MSPRSRKETEQFREERKKQIMDVALELFSRKGYYSTTVVQIAQEAGISKGLMYNYFKSREELLQLIMEKGLDMLLSGFDMNRDGKISKEEFEGFIDNSFDIMKSNKEFFKLYISVLMQPEAINLFKKKMETMADREIKKVTAIRILVIIILYFLLMLKDILLNLKNKYNVKISP